MTDGQHKGPGLAALERMDDDTLRNCLDKLREERGELGIDGNRAGDTLQPLITAVEEMLEERERGRGGDQAGA